jgi:multidrug efflux system membrane fusion protein
MILRHADLTKFCVRWQALIWQGGGAAAQYAFARPRRPRGNHLNHSCRALALTVVVPLAAAGCSKASQGAAGTVRGSARSLTVRVEPVHARDVVYKIQAVGTLEADEVVQVTAEVEGVVSAVNFNEGLRVTPQTVLARIDPDRYRLQAEQAEASYKKALADARRAASDMQRREQLAREQLVAAEELNRSRQEAERLAAEADSAKATWDIAMQNRRRSEVRAPHMGVINTKAVDTGQFVKMGNVLATLVDNSRLRLRFKVSEGESLRARPGQSVGFHVAALGGSEFTAQIYHVGEVADPSTRQVEVLAWVKNPGVLKPGFFAEITLASETRTNAVVVPERAVQASDRGFVAYVVEGNRARLRPLRLGIRTGDGGVEILSGVTPGENVVVEGSDRLADGIEVQTAPGVSGGSASAQAQ